MLELDPGVMIWAWITFFVLLLLLYKLAWKPILATIEKREQTIQDSLDRAEKAREEAEALLEQHNQLMRSAEEDAQRLLKENRELSEKSRLEILEQAKQSAEKLIENAKSAIEKEKQDALTALRVEVADLAVNATKKIIGESLDDKKQREIVSDYLGKIPDTMQN
jgi:F-type H+-transporting ATPase subunit b